MGVKQKAVGWLALAAVVIWAAILALPDKNLHIVFCNVGQGDATLIRWGTTEILVDGGPDSRVIKCLTKHMPFFDRRIEMAVLTHPQADHYTGLNDVFIRYNVMLFVRGKEEGKGEGWEKFRQITKDRQIPVQHMSAGDMVRWRRGESSLGYRIVWPTTTFLKHIGPNEDVNRVSLVGRVGFGQFETLLTGDADAPVQAQQLRNDGFENAEVLKVPHHGGRTGMTAEWLSAISPELAVISVGRNSFGHPAVEALEMLAKAGAEIKRTDLNGDVEVVSDGDKWWVR